MSSMKRGVGYCLNVGSNDAQGCEDYAKGVFLLNHGDTFYCPRCRNMGAVVKEVGFADKVDGAPFKEVRVEFNYEPIKKRYQEIAIVRDEAVWGRGSQYTLCSPLIKTEKRALKVAEAILANLQRFDFGDGDIPRSTEIVISFDEELPDFAAKMKRLGEEWEKSSLVVPKNYPREHAQD